MRCPYCAEEIQDAAIACRHCGRDFAFLRPAFERIHALEAELADLRKWMSELQRAGPTVAPAPERERPTRVSAWRGGTAVALYALVVLPLGLAPGNLPDAADAALHILPLSGPLLLGLWLGWTVEGRHGRAYAWVGALLGLVWFAYLATDVPGTELAGGPAAWGAGAWVLLIMSLVWGVVSAAAGGLVGDWIRPGPEPPPSPGRLTRSVARRVLAGRRGELPAEEWEHRIARLDRSVQAVKRIVGVVGSLAMTLGQVLWFLT